MHIIILRGKQNKCCHRSQKANHKKCHLLMLDAFNGIKKPINNRKIKLIQIALHLNS